MRLPTKAMQSMPPLHNHTTRAGFMGRSVGERVWWWMGAWGSWCGFESGSIAHWRGAGEDSGEWEIRRLDKYAIRKYNLILLVVCMLPGVGAYEL